MYRTYLEIRRYPGVSTQNTSDTYYLSEMPMPAHYPAWPSGAQVQAYLESFVTKFNLKSRIHLNEEVTQAVQDLTSPEKGWTVTTHHTHTDGKALETEGEGTSKTYAFDVLLVCNGTFSDCFVPHYKGIEEFKAAGGTVCHTSEFLNLEDARGKDVIVVGYGKSACDCAVALSRVAKSTVRHIWTSRRW
jgi:dimethylaniline monooxygenase (N-oxide forming)